MACFVKRKRRFSHSLKSFLSFLPYHIFASHYVVLILTIDGILTLMGPKRGWAAILTFSGFYRFSWTESFLLSLYLD